MATTKFVLSKSQSQKRNKSKSIGIQKIKKSNEVVQVLIV